MTNRITNCTAVNCGAFLRTDGNVPIELNGNRAINCKEFIINTGNEPLERRIIETPPVGKNLEINKSAGSKGYERKYAMGYGLIDWHYQRGNAPMKVTNNVVTGTDTFYRGHDNDAAIFDGNHFRDGRIFLDITAPVTSENSIRVPEGMTRDDLIALARVVSDAAKAGRDPEEAAKQSPWWERLLSMGANAATLIGALITSVR